ncbi:hypothetical protein AB0758_49435 [Tolypothrix bouteillei VB521301_2]|uniref:Uncharacterized protein n=1 Tax=Tolypothrix bouteillei VB521301 TaxID=1479485 RepID=A0A0C1REK3_9CYAN
MIEKMEKHLHEQWGVFEMREPLDYWSGLVLSPEALINSYLDNQSGGEFSAHVMNAIAIISSTAQYVADMCPYESTRNSLQSTVAVVMPCHEETAVIGWICKYSDNGITIVCCPSIYVYVWQAWFDASDQDYDLAYVVPAFKVHPSP